jgi:hypothetical protein
VSERIRPVPAGSESLGRLVDAVAPDGPTREMYRAFDWVVRLELQFLGAMHGDRS